MTDDPAEYAAWADEIMPLPEGMRAKLFDLLALGYSSQYAFERRDAPDAGIAWQVQSMLDDYADYKVLEAYHERDKR